MTKAPIADRDARTLREHWFRYLDTLEPLRAELFGYCRRLTGTVWEAEDLVQETLLKGFGMTARGDFHGPHSPVRDPRAYLFRTATNCWLDEVRRHGRLVRSDDPMEVPAVASDAVALSEALGHARDLTSATEFACLILKDAYDYPVADIADFVGTTPGTVKSALHRARTKIRSTRPGTSSASAEDRALAEALAAAINARDEDRVLGLMSDTLQISVCNVGGGRGRSSLWVRPTLDCGFQAEVAELDGLWVVVLLKDGVLEDVLRLAGSEGRLTRITDYCYAPDLLVDSAARLGYPCTASRYHQAEDILPGMIRTTTLPWRSR